jgi:plasmid replication initiation protein
MAEKAHSKKTLVKESNYFARARYTPSNESVWDERIIATIASRHKKNDMEFNEQLVDPRELTNGDNTLSNSQRGEMGKALLRLAKTVIEIKTSGEYTVIPMFESLSLNNNGYISGKFNKALKEHFFELEHHFTMLSLPGFRSLSSVYSQQLYRFLCSWESMGEITVLLDDLHKFLSTPPSFHKNFKDFRKYVLEIAHKEITDPKKTNMYYDWESIKAGLRKVIAIRFRFNPFLTWREQQQAPKNTPAKFSTKTSGY